MSRSTILSAAGLTTLALTAVLLGAQRGAPVPPTPPGTGLIVGQVVDGTTGKPVSEATVDLLPAIAPTSATSTSGVARVRVISDGKGRFFFPDLPPGRYNLGAAKPGYVQARGIQHRFLGLPNPIELSDGQALIDVRMPMWKYGTISGTVVDDAGDPVVGVEVRALRRTFVGGRPRFQGVLSTYVTTDDRGEFRLASLMAGDYVVVVPAAQTTIPASLVRDIAQSDAAGNELLNAIREVSYVAGPRHQVIGDQVLMTLNRQPLPPMMSSDRAGAYPASFYPASADGAPAGQVLTLPSGGEQVVHLQLRATSAVRVSGTIMGPGGPLARTALRLVPAALGKVMAETDFDTATGVTDNVGAFTLLGVPPGHYLLKVLTPPLAANAPTPVSTPDKPVLWATEAITVGDVDLTGLTITAHPTVRVTGRLEFLGSATPPDPISDLYVNLDAVAGGPSAVVVTDERGQFATGVPGGIYSLRTETPTGWRVKAIQFDGRDATDGPIEVTTDASLVFTLTNQVSELFGTVRDDRGAPDTRALVAVFPVNRAWWTGYPIASWRVRSTETSPNGVYRFIDLPAGEYYALTLPESLATNWQDPSTLARLARSASRVLVEDGERRVQDLKKATGRQP
jgi:hypothetical protein